MKERYPRIQGIAKQSKNNRSSGPITPAANKGKIPHKPCHRTASGSGVERAEHHKREHVQGKTRCASCNPCKQQSIKKGENRLVSACVCVCVCSLASVKKKQKKKHPQQAQPSQQARTRMPHTRNPSAKEIVTSNKKSHSIVEQCTERRLETQAPLNSATAVGAVVKRAIKKKGGE